MASNSAAAKKNNVSSDIEVLAGEIVSALRYRFGKDRSVATPYDWLNATIRVVRDRVIDQWIRSTKEAYDKQAKRVYYLSLEFLIGRLTRDAFSNIGMLENIRAALATLDVDLDLISALEPDAALGNGGLGRLAACFMESMATVDVPAHGYGIRYANGMFRQEISDGKQVELPETWLDHGNPWEFERRERSYRNWLRRHGGSDRRLEWRGKRALDSGRARSGRRLRYADCRLARRSG
jgi:starch phosphorylase